MRIILSVFAVLAVLSAGFGATAKPIDKAMVFPFAVKFQWASTHYLINAMQVSCRISDSEGNMVGRGSVETRLDPAFLSRRGTMEAVMPAVLMEGADPEEGLTCSCRARFDTRSPFFRSGTSRFGQLPWMFARPYRLASTSCAPLPARSEEAS